MQNNIPKRYLWAISDEVKTLPPGTLIADRYLLRGSQILLDTRPEKVPEIPDEIPDKMIPYLRLFPERLHIPQIYGMISPSASHLKHTIWLLEQAPIHPLQETLTPKLTQVWASASGVRQLNWLWQMAQLWQSCQRQQVASSLLDLDLLHVAGVVVQLLELRVDSGSAKLSQLGQQWQDWIQSAHSSIQNFLEQLTGQMICHQLKNPEQLIQQLDQALLSARRSLNRQITITTATDTGPVRVQNEDACYPEIKRIVEISNNEPGLAVVCDGIGGQEGGEVAANLAIDVLREQVKPERLYLNSHDLYGLMSQLENSVNLANDLICQRNDQEHRQGRERMGTTLILGLAYLHELYVTHVGDSRAYWITSDGCYQITLDDDVASREVRLGYALYQDALQQRASGALIQALGITNSINLHPTIQRFPIDEDCVILLCSDGLSDRDRVETYWSSEILPILQGQTDVATVRDRLIEIANSRNGHDNVTVALMHFKVSPNPEIDPQFEVSIPPIATTATDEMDDDDSDSGSMDSQLKTQFITPPYHQRKQIWRLSLGILLLLTITGFIIYILKLLNPPSDTENNISNPPPPVPSPQAPFSLPPPPPSLNRPLLELRSFIQVGSSAVSALPQQKKPLEIFQEFGQPWIQGSIPPGSIIQIIGKQSTPEAGKWLEVKICSLPVQSDDQWDESLPENLNTNDLTKLDDGVESIDIDSAESLDQEESDSELNIAAIKEIPTLTPGELGWVKESEVGVKMMPNISIGSQQKGVCQGED